MPKQKIHPMIHPLTMGGATQHLGPHTLNGQLQWSELTADRETQLERTVREAGAITDRPLRVVFNNSRPVNSGLWSNQPRMLSDIRYRMNKAFSTLRKQFHFLKSR